MQAAALLWPRQPDRAREIYSEAFDALLPAPDASADERALATRLYADLIANVARRDPDLAERFTSRLALPKEGGSNGESAASRAEILAAAATEMLPGDPARAADLGRLALAEQVTPAVLRFLVVLRGVDAARADARFGVAMALVARTGQARLGDVQMLAFYIGASGAQQFDSIPADLMRGYLETALRLITVTPLDSSDAATAYFLGRQLVTVVARYLPHRSPELDARISLLSSSAGFQQSALPAADRAKETPDASRARAATAAIERDDYRAVHAEAAAIEDGDLQSRVYAQAALRLIKLRRLDDASREIERVPDPARRATLLIQVALVARSKGDVVTALNRLLEAGREARRCERAGPRLQALFSVAAASVDVDELSAFEAMRAAIDAVNKAVLANVASRGETTALAPASLNFHATLARLARADFDRALLLAQSFDARGYRAMAVLAVCKGGLAASGAEEFAEELDDEAPSLAP
jgi:hypothetical protein